jgi:hypothetical protein
MAVHCGKLCLRESSIQCKITALAILVIIVIYMALLTKTYIMVKNTETPITGCESFLKLHSGNLICAFVLSFADLGIVAIIIAIMLALYSGSEHAEESTSLISEI